MQAKIAVWAALAISHSYASRLYIVHMKGNSVVGHQALAGEVNVNSVDAAEYAHSLEQEHINALETIGLSAANIENDYLYTLNGFAAELSEEQAEALRRNPEVLGVYKDELYQPDAVSTPQFLNLDGPNGPWEQLSGMENAGEDIVIGVIDTGIWPENPSFHDDGTYGPVPSRFQGSCTPGEEFDISLCNKKIVGAKFYHGGFGTAQQLKRKHPSEFVSARDAAGHGSHVAGTAAGNSNVEATSKNRIFGLCTGVAPRARIAVYKVCWGSGGCFTSDILMALEQVLKDKVDVVNYSISGAKQRTLGLAELAFLQLALSGVFIAASAGNSGPAARTGAHNSPWMTSVAAGTHDRKYLADVTLGENGQVVQGASSGTGSGEQFLPLILSTSAKKSGEENARLCKTNSLDRSKVMGKIVVCDRGGNARVEKSQTVKDAGGLGMILLNTEDDSLNEDLHAVPTVHLALAEAAAVRTYLSSTQSPIGKISASYVSRNNVAPDVARFSSRGPANLADGDVLTPDIMAPGVDIIAAYSPVESGDHFVSISGTSMSSPHIAGIAALLRHKFPNWSPAAVKSAIMTTASQLRSDGTPIPGTPFDFGSGHVDPSRAFDPGLIYDASPYDYLAFKCDNLGPESDEACGQLPAVAARDFNYAAIAIGSIALTRSVTRTVTNVDTEAATYHAELEVPAHFSMTVSPSQFTLQPGQSAMFTVTFNTLSGTPMDTTSFGSITWVDGVHSVRIPVVVTHNILIDVKEELTIFRGASNSDVRFPVQYAWHGSLAVRGMGLAAPLVYTGSLTMEQKEFAIELPVLDKATVFVRMAIFDGTDFDIDLFMLQGDQVVGKSEEYGSDEMIDVHNPEQDYYSVRLHLYSLQDADVAKFKLYIWMVSSCLGGLTAYAVPREGAGNLEVQLTLPIALSENEIYMGLVDYTGTEITANGNQLVRSLAPTIVVVKTSGYDVAVVHSGHGVIMRAAGSSSKTNKDNLLESQTRATPQDEQSPATVFPPTPAVLLLALASAALGSLATLLLMRVNCARHTQLSSLKPAGAPLLASRTTAAALPVNTPATHTHTPPKSKAQLRKEARRNEAAAPPSSYQEMFT
eukprot:g34796.t1